MKVTAGKLQGVLIIEPTSFSDERGFFLELYREGNYAGAGLPRTFVQDNHSRSVKGVLRGLHFQYTRPQGKLVWAARGSIFDVVVDLRRNSPDFGCWEGFHLNDENHRQLYIPPGFAHGFCVLSEDADVIYKCTDYYDAEDEGGILWSDPQIGIKWPIKKPILSARDSKLPLFSQIDRNRLPTGAS